MLTPDELLHLPDYIVKLYQDLEAFVIEDFARRVAKAGTITDMAKWQAIRAQELGMGLQDLKKEIKRVTELSIAQIDHLFEEAALTSLANDAPLYEQIGMFPPELERSETLRSYLDAAKEQTKGELYNLTRSMGFARMVAGKVQYLPLFEFYNKALDFAQFQVSAGVLDYNTAIRNAVREIAKSGLRTVNYESGWSNKIDVAARRAVLTGVNQMSSRFNDQVIEELGAEYVEVTAHSGARPDHKRWQGKVYKIQGSDPDYPNLYAVTGLGTGPGLCGWNCRHNYYAFFPGVSAPTYSEEQLENIDPPDFEYEGKTYTHYEATQKQRQIETAIRKTKNELIGYKAAGLEEDFTAGSIKLQQQKKYYRDFSNAADLRLQNDRHQVLGYGRSIAQKAVWANKRVVDKANQQYNKGSEEANVKAYQRDERTRKRIRENYPKTILEGKQGKHLIGHNNYTEGRSYLTISLEGAQQLIDRYAGTGAPQYDRTGRFKHQELIETDQYVGVCIDNRTGIMKYTNEFKIHYSKKGTHLVPSLKEIT